MWTKKTLSQSEALFEILKIKDDGKYLLNNNRNRFFQIVTMPKNFRISR